MSTYLHMSHVLHPLPSAVQWVLASGPERMPSYGEWHRRAGTAQFELYGGYMTVSDRNYGGPVSCEQSLRFFTELLRAGGGFI